MNKILYIVALCLATVVINNGCLSEQVKGEETQSIGGGGQCGTRVCGSSQFCCNESCSICAPLGGACTQQFCGTPDQPTEDTAAAVPGDTVEEPVSRPDVDEDLILVPQQCGSVTCSPGTHCCNASCGICVPPGGFCTQQICNPTE
jgi:hypothetical protein